jgi:cysteine desulfurase
MAANNVVGTLQPIRELAAVAKGAGALFHTDAVQAAGHIPLDVERLGVDLLSLSAHKFHGPKGAGVLYVRRGVPVRPLLRGGGQEHGLRPSTENVPALVGLGCAARLAREGMAEEAVRLVALRDRLLAGLVERIPGVYLIGHPHRRLPGHLCLGLEGVEAEAVKLMLTLDEAGVAASSGSACSSSDVGRPSHVLEAMCLGPIQARGPLRLTLGRFTTPREVDRLVDIVARAVPSLRSTVSRPRNEVPAP